MKVLAIILCLCLSQIVSVLGLPKGNCSDPGLADNLDYNCFIYNRAWPILYATCTQYGPDYNYYYRYRCDYLHQGQKSDDACAGYCSYYNYPFSCSYPSRGVQCACGRKSNYDQEVYFYAVY